MEKTVCVTGTDRGIGLALAKELLKDGYTVFGGGIAGENEAAEQLKSQYPGRFYSFFLDVGSDLSVKAFADAVMKRTDRLDLLINNAAIIGKDRDSTIYDPIDFADIQQVYNVTALGALRVSNALIRPVMNGGKLIVNISSEAGSVSNSYRKHWFGYCMAKAALNMGATIIHHKIREDGGRVIQIHPGWVKTASSGVWNDAGTYTPEEAAVNILRRVAERKDEIREQPLYIEADTGKEMAW